MGDWNAKVRSENEGQESVTGCYWYDTINERGEKLIDVVGKHNFFMTNTRFEQKATRKWIWLSLDGLHCNMIDLILIDKRQKSALWNCRTYQGADNSSGHSLVMCKFKNGLEINKKEQPSIRCDLHSL